MAIVDTYIYMYLVINNYLTVGEYRYNDLVVTVVVLDTYSEAVLSHIPDKVRLEDLQ